MNSTGSFENKGGGKYERKRKNAGFDRKETRWRQVATKRRSEK